MPWQQYKADVAYEYDPDTGLLMYDEADTLVPRQTGKTTLVRAENTHRLTVMARRLGPQRSAYYAQTRLASRKKLERDFAPALRSSRSFKEVPHSRARPRTATEWRLTLNNGSEAIEFGNGSFWQIDAPSRTGGHGDTLDKADIDEAFAHQDDTVEGSVRPAQATRESAQLGVYSTAGDVKSKYLWGKVLAGRAACLSGNHGRVAYFEWSAEDEADPADPATWRSCSPALGITISEDFLASEWQRALRRGQEGIDTFRRAYLNQWPEVPVLGDQDENGWHVVAQRDWTACLDPDHQPGDGLAWAIDVAADSAFASVGVSDGVHVELAAYEKGTAWLAPWLAKRRDKVPEVFLIGGMAPVAGVVEDLEREGVPYRTVTAQEQGAATTALLEDVATGVTRHIGQAPLTEAVRGAVTRLVKDVQLFAWGKSTTDVSPLVAVTLARWAACQSNGDVNIW